MDCNYPFTKFHVDEVEYGWINDMFAEIKIETVRLLLFVFIMKGYKNENSHIMSLDSMDKVKNMMWLLTFETPW